MSINFTNALGIHESALKLRAQRTVVLASNLANADTPGYKAKDIAFKEILSDLSGKGTNVLSLGKNPNHLALEGSISEPEIKYRQALQPSLDGNSVDSQIEKSEYLQNSTQYLASLQFLNQKIRGLLTAIRGE